MDQHQPLLHAISRILRRLRIPSPSRKWGYVYGGPEFEGGHCHHRRGGLRDVKKPGVPRQSHPARWNSHADAQARGHLYAAALTTKGQLPLSPSRASTSTILVRGQVPFDKRQKACPFRGGKLGASRREDGSFIDQSAASVVGGRDGGSLAKNTIYKEHIMRIVSVITHV